MKSHHFRAHRQSNANIRVPTDKTLRDRFNLWVQNRRAENRQKVIASGISEECTELQAALDDAIGQIDASAESVLMKTQAAAAIEKQLSESEEALRDVALHRKERKTSRSVDDFENSESSVKKAKRASKFDPFGDRVELELMREEVAFRRERAQIEAANETRRFELEERRLMIDAKRLKHEAEENKALNENFGQFCAMVKSMRDGPSRGQ